MACRSLCDVATKDLISRVDQMRSTMVENEWPRNHAAPKTVVRSTERRLRPKEGQTQGSLHTLYAPTLSSAEEARRNGGATDKAGEQE